MENKRFEITETAGSVKGFYVVVDKETGVNYVVAKFGTGVGICPLIDKNGKIIYIWYRNWWLNKAEEIDSLQKQLNK